MVIMLFIFNLIQIELIIFFNNLLYFMIRYSFNL